MPYAQPRLIKKEHSVNAEKGSAAARVNPAYLRGAVRRGSSPWQVPACAFCRDPFTWPAPGSEDTELGVLMELEVGHGETEVYPRVQA
jgi:hypothetical protein